MYPPYVGHHSRFAVKDKEGKAIETAPDEWQSYLCDELLRHR